MIANDDKLLKAMEEAGLFDSGDGDSSGSDWTPIMLSEKKKKKNILYQNKKKPCLEEKENFITQDDDSDRTSCGSNIEAYCTETINAVVHNPSTSGLHGSGDGELHSPTILVKSKKDNLHSNFITASFDNNKAINIETELINKANLEPEKDKLASNFETRELEDVIETANVEIGSLSEVNQELKNVGLLLNFETGILENISEALNVGTVSLHKTNQEPEKRKIINPVTGLLEEIITSASEIDDNVVEKRGKKRKSKPGTWKKNIMKKKNLKKYIMRDLPDCRCECKKKINKREAKNIFDKFISLQSHTEQNIYLQGCLQESVPHRFRPRYKNNPQKARTRRVFKYYVTKKNETVELCQRAFLNIHGIKRDRLQVKVQHPEKDIQDGRGKHTNHQTYSEETILKVHEFIENLPARESHYSRTCNKFKKYLDSNLTITELHRKYLIENPDNKITYEKFRQIFNTDFNISFGHPRKDICRSCEKNKVLIEAAEANNNCQEKINLERAQELHLRKAEVFSKRLSKTEKEKNGHKLSLCFDYEKNLPLPVTNIGDEYYLRQLWLHNFGVHNLRENTATMYLYTEQYALKGPNEVISALDDYIKNNKKPSHTHLELYCDNCFSQNKNRYLFTFLDQLCANAIFQKISVYYHVPGHSMMPIDRDFALIERKRLKSDKIYTPEYYVNLIKASKRDPFGIVFLEKNLLSEHGEQRTVKVKDFKRMYDSKIKTSIPGISTCRQVLFRRNDRPVISDSMTTQCLKPIYLYRTGVSRLIRGEPDNCYEGPLKLKPAKLADIKRLLQFIPEHLRHFYNDIDTESSSIEVNEEFFDDVE